jgi:hypothetical protein
MNPALPFRYGALALACGLAAAAGNAAAQSFPDFVVDEGAVSGANPATFTADKVTGNYNEVISFSGNTFQAALVWDAGQFVAGDGKTPVNSQLGLLTSNQYRLYGVFQGNGTTTTSGSATGFNFSPGGSLRIFLDPNSDTSFTAPSSGAAAFTTGNNSDDILIGTGTPASGQGTLDPNLPTCSGNGGSGINCGNLGASSSFSLTSAGSAYFTSPNPFYTVSFQSGQLNNFTPTGTQRINGSLDVIFGTGGGGSGGEGGPVPEPGTVALFGLGVLGLAVVLRRRRR